MLYQLSYSRLIFLNGFKKISGQGRIRTSEGLASRFTVCPR